MSKVRSEAFSRSHLRRARAIAARYQIIISYEDGEFYGRGLEMPYVMADGKSPDACVRVTREALTVAVAAMLERNERVPRPASNEKRTEQVNVRLTPQEKLLLEEIARSKGFRGISDFIRSNGLSAVR